MTRNALFLGIMVALLALWVPQAGALPHCPKCPKGQSCRCIEACGSLDPGCPKIIKNCFCEGSKTPPPKKLYRKSPARTPPSLTPRPRPQTPAPGPQRSRR